MNFLSFFIHSGLLSFFGVTISLISARFVYRLGGWRFGVMLNGFLAGMNAAIALCWVLKEFK